MTCNVLFFLLPFSSLIIYNTCDYLCFAVLLVPNEFSHGYNKIVLDSTVVLSGRKEKKLYCRGQ